MSLTTPHYDAVKAFMQKGGQSVPDMIRPLTEEDRLLRAKLQLEETLELLEALNVDLVIRHDAAIGHYMTMDCFDFAVGPQGMDILKTVDACIDCNVISTGTLVAMGVPDKAVTIGVDMNNLSKVADGVIRDENGKVLKPEGYQPPDILKLICTGLSDVDRRYVEALLKGRIEDGEEAKSDDGGSSSPEESSEEA